MIIDWLVSLLGSFWTILGTKAQQMSNTCWDFIATVANDMACLVGV